MSDSIRITVTVNGLPYERQVEPRLLLVQFIREELGLTGTHIGCDTTYCGACTVLLNGLPIKSCTMLAVQADEYEISTVESLEKNDKLHLTRRPEDQRHVEYDAIRPQVTRS